MNRTRSRRRELQTFHFENERDIGIPCSAGVARGTLYLILRTRSRLRVPSDSDFPGHPARSDVMADRNAARRGIEGILARLAQAEDVQLLLDRALDAAIDIPGVDMGNIQVLEPGNGA